MSEVLGSDAESFYKEHKNNIDSLTRTDGNWELKLRTILQNEIAELVNSMEG